MHSDVLESPRVAQRVADVEPAPVYTPVAEAEVDAGLSSARGIAKAIMISVPFWLVVGIAFWSL